MTVTAAFVGNPRCGKSTLVTKISKGSIRTEDWPGTTLEKRVGTVKGADIEIIDLPGIYSLSQYSPEETVSREFIAESRPDVIVDIVDVTNLGRNLYLTLQLLDCGIPMVVALNMMDEAGRKGIDIDIDRLSELLDCPVVPISARDGVGLDALVSEISGCAASARVPRPVSLGPVIERYVSKASDIVSDVVPEEKVRWHAVKLLEKDGSVADDHPDLMVRLTECINNLAKEAGDETDSLIVSARYDAADDIVEKSVTFGEAARSRTKRTDDILTNKYLAIPIFIIIMAGVYFVSVSTVGAWGTELLSGAFDDLGSMVMKWCDDNGVNEMLSGLLVNGIIAGVGSVLSFLPQMMTLFLLLGILEDVGYMSRVAFIMDRLFRYFGLSGKSFIPVLMGMGCAVPGVMATRTIESERERRITAMVVPFMPCSSKLPTAALIASALFGGSWVVGVFAYFLGILCVLLSGIILKKWNRLSGKPAPFILELTSYHRPAWGNIVRTTVGRSLEFIRSAGTVILLACVVIWVLSSFDMSLRYLGQDMESSILASIGHVIAMVFAPIGWNEWELAVCTLAGVMAKENIIGTMGILLPQGIATLVTAAGGLSFMVFNLTCIPCVATIGALKKELGGWKGALPALGYQCLMAYTMSLVVYSVYGIATGVAVPMYTLVMAAVAVCILAYAVLAKDPFRQNYTEVCE